MITQALRNTIISHQRSGVRGLSDRVNTTMMKIDPTMPQTDALVTSIFLMKQSNRRQFATSLRQLNTNTPITSSMRNSMRGISSNVKCPLQQHSIRYKLNDPKNPHTYTQNANVIMLSCLDLCNSSLVIMNYDALHVTTMNMYSRYRLSGGSLSPYSSTHVSLKATDTTIITASMPIAIYLLCVPFSSPNTMDIPVTITGTILYHIASLCTPVWSSSVLKFCNWKYCDSDTPMKPMQAHEPMSIQDRFLSSLPLIRPKRAMVRRQQSWRKNMGAATVWKRVFMQGPAKRRQMPMFIWVMARIGCRMDARV
ncbi:hypothetical protein FGO68_gene1777 [Halteria grandinella]|uniref:Uncharacterized protein n=1 Tax=Halteria grandinella TaxID=5974 RepID=A0A8J8NRN9_HALGN|nr:hypothetical protein FGO68_gene1777 [Halteria grandinella]